MTPMVDLAVVAAAALFVGLVIGWLIGIRKRSNRDVIVDLETRLERAIESRADYESEVTEHFTRTAELLNQLTKNYSAVYNHLASGADTLCDGNVAIAGPSLNGLEKAEIPAGLVDVTQPLDYAPRKDDEDEGQLSESFGLDKPAFTEPKEDTTTQASV